MWYCRKTLIYNFATTSRLWWSVKQISIARFPIQIFNLSNSKSRKSLTNALLTHLNHLTIKSYNDHRSVWSAIIDEVRSSILSKCWFEKWNWNGTFIESTYIFSTQWAAVKTHLSPISDPPQFCTGGFPVVGTIMSATIQGHIPSEENCPPTTLLLLWGSCWNFVISQCKVALHIVFDHIQVQSSHFK